MTADLTIFPVTILIDTRESLPFPFLDLKDNGKPLVIRTQRATLETGDYSLEGYETRVAIERKSIEDLFGCCGHDRDRFERQVQRLSAVEFGAVCVEADEFQIRTYTGHGAAPRSVLGTVDSWELRYRVPFWLCRTRAAAEAKTLRALRVFLRHDQERLKRNNLTGTFDLVRVRNVHHASTSARAERCLIAGREFWVPRELMGGETQAAAGHGELILPRWWAMKHKVPFEEMTALHD